MDVRYLRVLTSRYRAHASDDPDALDRIVRRHQGLRRTRLMDLAAVAVSLAYMDREALDGLAVQAIRDTNPAFDPDALHSYSEAQWLGMLNAAKGKYFEYLVVDRLNAGETVGDLQLLPGQQAVVAESMNQAGWDVRIVDADGRTVEFLQMKATASAGYVKEALDRYPDIRIVATDEVADHAGSDSRLLDVDMSEADLRTTISDTYAQLAPGTLDQFWQVFNPLIPLLVIAGTQGYGVLVGRQRFDDAVAIASERAARGLVASSTGALVKVMADSLLLGASAGVVAGMFFDRVRNTQAMGELVRHSTQRQGTRSAYLLGWAEARS